MFDRPNLDEQSKFGSRPNYVQQYHEEKQRLDEVASRVSTDSDLYLESEDEDDYRSTFSDRLMRRLVAVELAQQQQIRREEKLVRSASLQLLPVVEDDSYWAKMRRVSQWRQSTHQSENSSDYSPPAPASRKRRLSSAISDTSSPASPKRARVMALSPAPPGSPFFPRPRMYSLDLPREQTPEPGAYARSYIVRAEITVQPYSGLDTPHTCTACDTTFASRQRLRRHGRGAWTPDACRAAVTYGLE